MSITRKSSALEHLEERYGSDEDLSYLPENFFEMVDELPKFIRSRVAVYYPEIGQIPCSVRNMAVMHSTYPIFAFRIASPGFVKDIYVKFAPVYPHKNEGLVEYNNLQQVHKCFHKGRGYCSPRPLEFIHELNALVTEGVAGVPFREVLLRDNWIGASDCKRNNLKQIVQRCGYWLREFHEAGGIEFVPFELEGEKGGVVPTGKPGNMPRSGQISGWVNERIKASIDGFPRNAPIPVSRVHGDLALDNILVNGQDINVLDVSYDKKDLIFEDVASFLANLVTINTLPMHPLYNLNYVGELNNSFLAAYGILDYPDHGPLLRACLIKAVFGRFESQVKSLKSRIPGRLCLIPMVYLRRKYDRILNNISNGAL